MGQRLHHAFAKQEEQLQERYKNLMRNSTDLGPLTVILITLYLFAARRCPLGWIKFQCSCYRVYTSKRTWENSHQYCKSQQAALVIINSREEQVFVNSLLPDNMQSWMGLSDIRTEGVWTWVDGTTLNTS
ncbi:C-type lectin domain family 4 member M-like [Gadus macrocephalus]|uniref:C-type lectin domain family 4 member M-like n=1 Tax=Gadus macrocephalus TaxID=80720 RepID=UPI0028CB9DED|nr:C-type lectin domain family 4 member M-like [Gadus macrocephalus]